MSTKRGSTKWQHATTSRRKNRPGEWMEWRRFVPCHRSRLQLLPRATDSFLNPSPTTSPMKATLEFSLPDEQHAYKAANLSSEMSGVLWDLDAFLRSGIKYGPDGDQWKTAEALAAHIRREYLANIIDRLEC